MALATPNKGGNYDEIYSKMVSEDLTVIIDICRDTSATTQQTCICEPHMGRIWAFIPFKS